MAIGSGRHVRVAVLFFDLRGFSKLTSRAGIDANVDALIVLDLVIPMVTRIVHDFGGFLEKNTGDGVMAVFDAANRQEGARCAMDAAKTIFSGLKGLVNPVLAANDISPVDARIGIDMGRLIYGKIGTPTGAAHRDRNFMVAIGPAANIACRLQQAAGTNQIWVGNTVKSNYKPNSEHWRAVNPPNWTWGTGTGANRTVYQAWRFAAVWSDSLG